MRSKILDYFEFEKANALLEDFNRTTGFVTAILDLDETSCPSQVVAGNCTDYTSPSDTANTRISNISYRCRDGEKIIYRISTVWWTGAPIVIRGEHHGNCTRGFLFGIDSLFKRQAAPMDSTAIYLAAQEVQSFQGKSSEIAIRFYGRTSR